MKFSPVRICNLLFCLVCSFIALGIGGYLIGLKVMLLTAGVQATGTVTGKDSTLLPAGVDRIMEFSFYDSKGVMHRFGQDVSQETYDHYRNGGPIQIDYLPWNPKQYAIAGTESDWTGLKFPVGVVGLGLFLMTGFFVLLTWYWQKSER